MIFHKQEIEGVFIIEPEPFKDERGVFRRNYCLKEFHDAGICSDIMNANISENKFKYTIRGFHYQMAPYREAKTLTVVKGSIYDIIIDLRPESLTYLQYRGWAANAEGRLSIHVPAGCANAFITLEDDTVVHYYVSEFYSPKHERGIRYNDPLIFNDISPWPIESEGKIIISEKDKNWPDYVKETV